MSAKIYDTTSQAFVDAETPKVNSGGVFTDAEGKVYSGGAWEDAWKNKETVASYTFDSSQSVTDFSSNFQDISPIATDMSSNVSSLQFAYSSVYDSMILTVVNAVTYSGDHAYLVKAKPYSMSLSDNFIIRIVGGAPQWGMFLLGLIDSNKKFCGIGPMNFWYTDMGYADLQYFDLNQGASSLILYESSPVASGAMSSISTIELSHIDGVWSSSLNGVPLVQDLSGAFGHLGNTIQYIGVVTDLHRRKPTSSQIKSFEVIKVN